MNVIFHSDRRWGRPKYHRGQHSVYGIKANCGSRVYGKLAIDSKDEEEVFLPIIQLCGNCFRSARKTKAGVRASRISLQPAR